MAQQIHAAVGVQIINHPAAARKSAQIAARVCITADNHTAMLTATAVRPFVLRATDHLHLPAQLGQQRVAAGLAEQQVRRPPQRQ